MSNFKSGSGNLDFGGNDDDQETESAGDSSQTETQKQEEEDQSTTAQTPTTSQEEAAMDSADSASQSDQNSDSQDQSKKQYPYFIRRNNVGDERDKRLEIHVRDKVADQESAFRNELAEQLGTNEVSKTDAREFALLAAFQHPERVAELMEEEGFGTF